MLESFICLPVYLFTNYTWINSSTIQQINSIGKSDIYPVFSITTHLPYTTTHLLSLPFLQPFPLTCNCIAVLSHNYKSPKMKKLQITLTVLLFSITSLLAQTSQTVKGIIIDQQSEMPLIGATIQLVGAEGQGTITDVDGYFSLSNIPLGRRTFQVSYLGYLPLTLPNIEVTAGKEVVLEIALEESVEKLQEVVVVADAQKDKAQNELATISARTFSLEEVVRYSGGRSDVGRLAANFAGVSTPDDSRNDIVIRGNAPTGVLWRLEGIPIPNPNHFSTLGTTGGPVSALNPNLLKNSDFLTSAFPAEYGNALAGVFDLGFRNGNRDNHEFTFQLGAVSGIEALAEGPINKKNGSSYLVATRYSFVGIATAAGIDIGTNAVPNYRDIAFKFDLGKSKLGRFTLFGIGGSSDIDFLHDETDEGDLFAATDEDAFATSKFGVVGIKHNLILGERTYLRTVLGYSTSQNVFDQYRFFDMDTDIERRIKYFETDNTQNRLSFSSFVNRKFNAKWTGRAGILIEDLQNDISANTRENRPDRDNDGINDWARVYGFDGSAVLLQPFIQTQFKPTDTWTFNAGLHAQYYNLNEQFVLEPRLAANYHLSSTQTLNIGYGLHHQSQPIPIQLLEEEVQVGVFEATNKDLDFTRSHHFVIGYDVKLGSDWRAKIETYYQGINKVPVEPFPSSFSILNIGDDFGFPEDVFNLQNTGTGNNKGIELTLEKFFSQGFYGLLTTSVFDSKYKGSDGVERNTAFNNGYVLNILGGKEFKLNNRFTFTFDTKLTTAGGRYFTPVDLVTSKIAQTEILQEELAYSERYDPYFRWDVKFGLKVNSKKRKLSHHFFFDVQNVTNRENIFAQQYNRQTNEVNTAYQLGFFPDFMYRIQF